MGKWVANKLIKVMFVIRFWLPRQGSVLQETNGGAEQWGGVGERRKVGDEL